jgi:DNA-binding NtrC family response regulator
MDVTPFELEDRPPPRVAAPRNGTHAREAEDDRDADAALVDAEDAVVPDVLAEVAPPPLAASAVRRTVSAFPSVHAEGGAPARRGGRKPRPAVPVPNAAEPGAEGTWHGFVGESDSLKEALREIERAARSDVTVLLVGESGTGKELAARAIHLMSRRKAGPFVPVHTGAIPRELVASELFGHERGAFTGATRQQRGKFEVANLGTLFLDEIATMDLHSQVSLLRVMENCEFARVGSETTMRVDVRVVAATNSDLGKLVDDGEFREDLFYRLHVFPIRLPPLRARPGDVDLLVAHFARAYAAEAGLERVEVAPAALELLRAYGWPGNVRELKNALQRAVLRADGGAIEPCHLPEDIGGRAPAQALEIEIGMKLAEVESRYIRETLAACGGNKKETAKSLGISRKSLYNKLTRYKIT